MSLYIARGDSMVQQVRLGALLPEDSCIRAVMPVK